MISAAILGNQREPLPKEPAPVQNASFPVIANLTGQVGNDRSPSFSPDGKRIVFISDRGGNPDIFIMNANGTEKIRLTSTPAVSEDVPSFAPSGDKILFGGHNGSDGEIYIMNSDGSQVQNISNSPSSDEGRPRFSTAGRSVTFDSDRTDNFEIYTAHLQADQLTDITQITRRPELKNRLPSFSPSGDHILFRAEISGEGIESSRLYLIDPDGTDPTKLSEDDSDYYPAMSPQGKWIAFVSTRSGNPEIFARELSKPESVQLTHNPAVDGDPAFSPDGKRIAFTSNRRGVNNDILMMRFSP